MKKVEDISIKGPKMWTDWCDEILLNISKRGTMLYSCKYMKNLSFNYMFVIIYIYFLITRLFKSSLQLL